jgi:hypothetical protein
MSAGDLIRITTGSSLKETLELFVECLGEDKSIVVNYDKEVIPRAAAPYSNKFIANALKVNYPLYSFLPETFGITPTVEIMLDFNKWLDLDDDRTDVLRAVICMLSRGSWDIALFHLDDEVVLLRKAGQLKLKKNHRFWTPQHLEMIQMPYEMTEIPNL